VTGQEQRLGPGHDRATISIGRPRSPVRTVTAHEPTVAQELADAAHQVCPYSNATRSNIDVTVSVVDD